MEQRMRTVLLILGTDVVLVLTDATTEKIKEWCVYCNQHTGTPYLELLDCLRQHSTVKVISSEENVTFSYDDIEAIGYNEAYDIADYKPKHSMMKLYRVKYKEWDMSFERLNPREMLSVGISEVDAIERAKNIAPKDARDFCAEKINTVLGYNIVAVE